MLTCLLGLQLQPLRVLLAHMCLSVVRHSHWPALRMHHPLHPHPPCSCATFPHKRQDSLTPPSLSFIIPNSRGQFLCPSPLPPKTSHVSSVVWYNFASCCSTVGKTTRIVDSLTSYIPEDTWIWNPNYKMFMDFNLGWIVSILLSSQRQEAGDTT